MQLRLSSNLMNMYLEFAFGFLSGILFILISLSCASVQFIRELRLSDTTKNGMSGDGSHVRCDDTGHGKKDERVLLESTDEVRRPKGICTTT